MNTQFKKGVVEMCVMHILAKKDLTAYDVLNKLEKALNVNANTVYPILRRLEEDKLLLYKKVQQKMGAPRKLYSLSELGKSELELTRKEYLKMANAVKSILGE
jgi:PadR family transcriptional regulator PadR